jgi:hypothetical protein
MLVEIGQVGLTVNSILLKDICLLMQPLFLEQRPPKSVFVFHHHVNLSKSKTDFDS